MPQIDPQIYDIAVIGGGINGCGVARDAAGRGYSVLLVEKGDLAQGTSSGSTKLIHGGLRYLEHYAFRLVRESLTEREVLWQMAPHIIRPLRFVLPHTAGQRPAWLLRAGLFLYDHIGGRRRLPPTRSLDLRHDEAGAPLNPRSINASGTAFEYSDCWVDDARLVVLNARDAANRGARIATHTAPSHMERIDGRWHISVRGQGADADQQVAARLIVNAAGPWVDNILSMANGHASDASRPARQNVRLVQGSHIVVPRLYEHDRCYTFQNPDGRVLFAIPYERDFTLIGTTDRDFSGTPDHVSISENEVSYLCAAASAHFKKPTTPGDVVWSYSAVRPLYDDGSSKAQDATRDYVLTEDGENAEAKLINIFGGKITTYRRLAEEVLGRIDNALGRTTASWSAVAPLPGGNFARDETDAKLADLVHAYPFLRPLTAQRLFRQYGTLATDVLGDANSWSDLGRDFGASLSEREVRYLQSMEWAQSAEDILWRRSKLGLRMQAEAQARLSDFLERNPL